MGTKRSKRSKRRIVKQDDYITRVQKLVTPEIIALYLVIAGGLTGQIPGSEKWILTIAGAVCLIATPIYLRYIEKVKGVQVVINTVSFAVWLYAIKGPFEAWGIYYGEVASLLLILWVTLTGLFYKKS
jgi:uncharacterized integral membrane protein